LKEEPEREPRITKKIQRGVYLALTNLGCSEKALTLVPQSGKRWLLIIQNCEGELLIKSAATERPSDLPP
jgi:hypothetical protein